MLVTVTPHPFFVVLCGAQILGGELELGTNGFPVRYGEKPPALGSQGLPDTALW
jgi:hypothetical protein